MNDVPETAITAAFELWSELADCAGVWPPSPQTAFRAGWTAAVPHVTAAEREACAQLAESQRFIHFAGMIRAQRPYVPSYDADGSTVQDDRPPAACPDCGTELNDTDKDTAGLWCPRCARYHLPPSGKRDEAGQAAYAEGVAAERERWSRDAIIAKLAARFGPHKAYVSATRSYEPDGNDAEGSCMISEPHEYEDFWLHLCGDGPCDCQPVKRIETQLRPLTYGEIADSLDGAT